MLQTFTTWRNGERTCAIRTLSCQPVDFVILNAMTIQLGQRKRDTHYDPKELMLAFPNASQSFYKPMQLKLTVLYRTPSLNKTMRQHWAVQYKEKKLAWDSLLDALKSASLCSESGVLIQTTPQLPQRIYSMACDTLDSYLKTTHGQSASKSSKKKLNLSIKKKQK